MEISRRVAEQLKQLMRRVTFLESRLQSIPDNTSTGGVHYLVEAGVDGIPAFVDPVPGMANCTIVRRFSDHTAEDKQLATSTTKRRVYNLGREVLEGEIVLAHLDAYGDLFIPAGNLSLCDAFWSTAPLVTLATGDQVLVLREGCLKVANVDPCEEPAEEVPNSSDGLQEEFQE